MPLYSFECQSCKNEQDEFHKIAFCPNKVRCNICGERSVKVISSGHGSIRCDSMNNVPWLESAVANLQPDHERPVQTRGEYKRYLRDNGIIASG